MGTAPRAVSRPSAARGAVSGSPLGGWVALALLLPLGCAPQDAALAPPAGTPAPVEATSPAADALLARHREQGATPAGALAVWLEAAMAYPDDPQGSAAVIRALTLPLRDDPDWASKPSNRTFVERLEGQPHVFRSYAEGATPDNGYAVDRGSWTLAVDHVEAGDPRGTKIFVRSGGADSPRPAYLKQSTTTGLYYLDEFSSLYVGIRPIVDPDAERFE